MSEPLLPHADILKLWKRLSSRHSGAYWEIAAADIGVPGSRVHKWIFRKNVPTKYWPRLIDAVRRRFGIEITTLQLTMAVAAEAESQPGEDKPAEAA